MQSEQKNRSELTGSLNSLSAMPLTMALNSDSVNNGTDSVADVMLNVMNSTIYSHRSPTVPTTALSQFNNKLWFRSGRHSAGNT